MASSTVITAKSNFSRRSLDEFPRGQFTKDRDKIGFLGGQVVSSTISCFLFPLWTPPLLRESRIHPSIHPFSSIIVLIKYHTFPLFHPSRAEKTSKTLRFLRHISIFLCFVNRIKFETFLYIFNRSFEYLLKKK